MRGSGGAPALQRAAERVEVAVAPMQARLDAEVGAAAAVLGQIAVERVGLELQSFDSNVFFASYAEDGPSYNGELDLMQWSDGPFFPDPDHYYWLCSEIPTDDAPDGANAQRICDRRTQRPEPGDRRQEDQVRTAG